EVSACSSFRSSTSSPPVKVSNEMRPSVLSSTSSIHGTDPAVQARLRLLSPEETRRTRVSESASAAPHPPTSALTATPATAVRHGRLLLLIAISSSSPRASPGVRPPDPARAARLCAVRCESRIVVRTRHTLHTLAALHSQKEGTHPHPQSSRGVRVSHH